MSVRFGLTQVAQLLLAAILVSSGLLLYFDNSYREQVVEDSQRAHAAVLSANDLDFSFPSGDKIFPHHRLIALYGTPDTPVLGVLGRQNVQDSISRVMELSKKYQSYMSETALPTFEIIATVASKHPTNNNDYSSSVSIDTLRQWTEEARKNGVYVILDLQPGRTDFLTQAKQLKSLLVQPNVGLALDPEWRLKKHQVPLVQIGAVSIREVNETASWLAKLTRQYNLPQKIFLLHQFRIDMLPDREKLKTHHEELAFAIQMDGQGTQSQKRDTWQAILQNAPKNTKFGWKNFLTKDTKTLTPKQTMKIKPQPWYISYQ